MKKILLLSFISSLIIVGCRKSDNPEVPQLTRFPLPLVTKIAGTDQVISAADPASFTAKFNVDLYFKNDVPPQKMDVVVIKNDNKAAIKTLQADLTSFPTTFTITGAQLATLFGAPIVLGDKFDIGVDVTTKSGQKYLAFPATGNAYASGVAAQPGASTFVRYEAVCQYDPEIYQGSFVVVEDEWADYSVGDVVELTKIDDTHFSFEYGADNAKPIVVTVDPNTNAVSVAKQVYGDYGDAYGNYSAESIPSVNNFVAPCDQVFSVFLKHTVSAGSFGEYKIVLRKQ